MNILDNLMRRINSIPAKRFPVCDICENLAGFAYGGPAIYRSYESIDGRYVLTFKAHMYEPFYECFEVGCDVYIKDNMSGIETVLYAVDGKCIDVYKYEEVTTGNLMDAERYITTLDTRFVRYATMQH